MIKCHLIEQRDRERGREREKERAREGLSTGTRLSSDLQHIHLNSVKLLSSSRPAITGTRAGTRPIVCEDVFSLLGKAPQSFLMASMSRSLSQTEWLFQMFLVISNILVLQLQCGELGSRACGGPTVIPECV